MKQSIKNTPTKFVQNYYKNINSCDIVKQHVLNILK